MRSKIIIYPLGLMLMLGIPLIRYYSTTPGVNQCVQEYVENIEETNYWGYMYNINGVRHIESGNSNSNNSLKKYQIGKANGCIMVSDDLFADMNNTFYCTVSYIINKLPIDDRFKAKIDTDNIVASN